MASGTAVGQIDEPTIELADLVVVLQELGEVVAAILAEAQAAEEVLDETMEQSDLMLERASDLGLSRFLPQPRRWAARVAEAF